MPTDPKADYDEDAVIELWSVILSTACLDYLATRYPKTATKQLNALRRILHYADGIQFQEQVLGIDLKLWVQDQQRDLQAAFSNGLGDIAELLSKRELIEMVLNQHPEYRRVRYYIQKSKTFRRL